MEILDRLKDKWRKRKAYKQLLSICTFESNNGVPWDLDIGFAHRYFEAGEYEQYFDDIAQLNKEALARQRERLVE